jgi:hypothetical protein
MMTKEAYLVKVMQIARRFDPHAARKIEEDLNDLFLDAHESGEKDEDVIRRLPEPKAYVIQCLEEMGKDPISRRRRGRSLKIGLKSAAFAVCLVLYLLIDLYDLPPNAIGGADASTSIQFLDFNKLYFIQLAVLIIMVIIGISVVVNIRRKDR